MIKEHIERENSLQLQLREAKEIIRDLQGKLENSRLA